MDVDYDDFIRTSDERHAVVVQKIFRQLYDRAIYLQGYWYCILREFFYGFQVKTVVVLMRTSGEKQRESYFFRLEQVSGLADHIIETHPDYSSLCLARTRW